MAKEGKKYIDVRGLTPKYIYVVNNIMKAYRHPKSLCSDLGLSYDTLRQDMNKEESKDVLNKTIIIEKTMKDGKLVYNSGKIILKDLAVFCEILNLTKKEVLATIKKDGNFQIDIELKRYEDYEVHITYEINGLTLISANPTFRKS